MQTRIAKGIELVSSGKRWTRSCERSIRPRRYLCVLPVRTRPSLFGGD